MILSSLICRAIMCIKKWVEIDFMEYSSDTNAQAAYVTDSAANLQSYSESTIKTQGSYALKVVASKADAFDSYTKLVSSFDGADAATAYTDPIAGAATFVGTAQLDTAQKKFGTASLYVDGETDYITYPDSDDWNFGTGNFTIDFWVRYNATGSQYLYHQYTDIDNQIYIYTNGSGYYIQFKDGGTIRGYYGCSATIATDTWYHLAFVRSGTTGYIFINGVSQTVTAYTAYGSNTMSNIASILAIGGTLNGSEHFNGWIDEVRISKGIARWTSNFTPPTAAYDYTVGGSLNKTLTRTLASNIDLSGVNTLKLDMRASRTGANIKVGLHNVAYITQTNTTDNFTDTLYSENSCWAQGFEVSTTNPITKFNFKLYRSSGATGTLTGYIYSSSSNLPNTAVATFSTVAMSTVTTSTDGAEYNFTGTFIPTASTRYHMVVKLTGWTTGDTWGIRQDNTSSYANGNRSYSYNGTDWSTGNFDNIFKLYQETTTELTPTISSADTYENKTWDISGVADADKNAIDKIIFTPVNADSANTVYFDNLVYQKK